MTNFYVRWYASYYDADIISKVYFIDSVRDRFLVVNDGDKSFHWVDISDCEIVMEERDVTR